MAYDLPIPVKLTSFQKRVLLEFMHERDVADGCHFSLFNDAFLDNLKREEWEAATEQVEEQLKSNKPMVLSIPQFEVWSYTVLSAKDELETKRKPRAAASLHALHTKYFER